MAITIQSWKGSNVVFGNTRCFTEISDHGSQMASKIFGKISKYTRVVGIIDRNIR